MTTADLRDLPRAVEIPFTTSLVACDLIDRADANELLTRWGHYLGPIRRPFGSQAFALTVRGEPVAVAVSASTVSATVRTDDGDVYRRREMVELARLCSAERWATRVMVRLWREVCAPAWPYWPVTTAVAYSQSARHEGDVYRFDGWRKVGARSGSSGGGSWSSKRTAGDAVHGIKALWVWRYGIEDES